MVVWVVGDQSSPYTRNAPVALIQYCGDVCQTHISVPRPTAFPPGGVKGGITIQNILGVIVDWSSDLFR